MSEEYIGGPGGRPLPTRRLGENGNIVFDLASTARADADALRDAPRMLRKALERGAWREFADPYTREVFKYGPDEFEKFTQAKRPAGLELPEGIKTLIGMCELAKADTDAAAALVILLGLMQPEAKHGGKREKNEQPDNVRLYGNSDTYLLRRLKRDHAELAAKVVSGEMTAHAAGVAAGFVRLMIQHEPTVEGFERAIRKHLRGPEILALKELL